MISEHAYDGDSHGFRFAGAFEILPIRDARAREPADEARVLEATEQGG